MCEEAILRKTSLLKHSHVQCIHWISKGLRYKRFWVITNKDPIKNFWGYWFLPVLVTSLCISLRRKMTRQRNYWFCMISCLSDLPLSTQKDTDCSWHKSWRMVSLIDSARQLSEKKNDASTINPLLISESFKFFSHFLMFSKGKKKKSNLGQDEALACTEQMWLEQY